MTPPLIGLRFYDHSMHNALELAPIECDVVGWLYKEDKLSYYIATWICDSKVMDQNTEAFQILKSTVVSRYEIKAKKVDKFNVRGRRRAKD